MSERARKGRRSGRKPAGAGVPWALWPDEQLLGLQLRDLDVQLEGTWVEERVAQLEHDLARRGLRFRPPVWVSSEWFSPLDVPGIAVPFYLLHPRLMLLERKQMLEVEGGSREECLKILRHECGHAIQRAYNLHRRRKWQNLFGKSSTPYPTSYRPDPGSRQHVQHLRLYYAQAHPDEDFAETFAVWLRPRHVWRRRYEGWPALKKLEYVDELMAEIGDRAPAVRRRRAVDPLEKLTETLREHYVEKREHYAPGAMDIFDADLRRVFESPGPSPGEPASKMLRRNRRRIRRMVRRWTGEFEFTLDQVLDEMIQRTRELGLRAMGDEQALMTDFALMLSVNATHFLYNKKHWIPL